MNIIPFEGKTLPAYLKAFNVSELNSELAAHASVSYPVLSIKGKVWAVVRDGERVVLPNPRDPESPATYIEVGNIKASPHTNKVFYLKGYDPDASEKQKPDCYSNDGVAPAADAKNPQAKQCAGCPHNQWGSRSTDKGTSKGKACNDTVRLAVAPAGTPNDPMLLRVPPASIRALGEYGEQLEKRGIPVQAVVTRIGFDSQAESPKLTFKAIGFLDEQSFAAVMEQRETDTVQKIVSGNMRPAIETVAEADVKETAARAVEKAKAPATVSKSKSKTVTVDEVKAAVEEAAPEATPEAVAKPATKVVSTADDLEIELDGISFDD